MRHVISTFFRGLAVMLPVVVTVWLVTWTITSIEGLLRPLILLLIPSGWYLPGLGIVVGLLLIFLVGLLLQNFLFERLWSWFESILSKVPVVKLIYNAVSDFISFFSSENTERASRVVSIDIGEERRLIGFITDESPARFTSSAETVAVYFPMSYQVGGYMMLVPTKQITPLDIPVEDAMRLVLTAGVRRIGAD